MLIKNNHKRILSCRRFIQFYSLVLLASFSSWIKAEPINGATRQIVDDRLLPRMNPFDAHLMFAIFIISALLLGTFVLLLVIIRNQKREIFDINSRLALVTENSLEGIVLLDPDDRVTNWNLGAEKIFGYRPEQVIGHKLERLIVPADKLDEQESIRIRVTNGDIIESFSTLRRKLNGTEISIYLFAAPLHSSDGRFVGQLHIIQDRTREQTAADQIRDLTMHLENEVASRTAQLESSRRNLQTVLDAVPAMIGYWDSDLIIRFANRAYQDWFALIHENIPGMHASELLGEALFAANRPYMEGALKGEKQTFNRTLATPSGIRHSLAHYLPDFSNGEVKGFYVVVHDITEITETNRKLQAALRENKALLTTIDQQMLYSVTDIQGNIIDANSNFCRATGYSHDELMGKNHRILNSGVHPWQYWRDMWKTITQGNAWHGEVCNRGKTGDLYWFDTVIVPFVDVDEKTTRYISLRSDITERKRAEAERNQLTLLINSVLTAASEVSIIATDKAGTITIFNSGAEHMLGYTAEEIVGKNDPGLFHLKEEVLQRGRELSEEYGEAIEGFRVFVHYSEMHGSETRNWTYVRKDGSRLQVSVAVTTMRDHAGNITGYLGIAIDVTDELKSKLALKSTIEQFSIATDVAELGVWSWSFDEDRLDWNDRMFDIYSLPKELRVSGLRSKDWLARVHPEDVEYIKDSVNNFIQQGGIYDAVIRILGVNNTIRYIQFRARIERDETGRPVKATGVNRDITSERELEAWLRQAKENADSANAAKSAFLANMSHEIRTPMNAILGMLELVQKTELTPRQQDYLAKTHVAAKALLGLLNNILDFSKIESGKLQLDSHPFDIELVMRDLATILYGNRDQKPVEIIFDLDSLLPPILIGDRLRLHQVLINLAGNALKFTHQGYVLITLKILEQISDHIQLHVSVSDTGIGINQKNMDHIFEGFVQAEASTTRRFGGTGLGLSISKRLVSILGGDLKAESTEGTGSRFWFDIPLNTYPADPLHQSTNIFNNLQFLVADDNEIVRRVISNFVTRLGGEVDEATAGLDAVTKVRTANEAGQPYHFVLIDSQMPDLDGLTVAGLIRNIPDLKEPITIFLMTSLDEEGLASQNMDEFSNTRFLNKPITPQQLADAVRQAMTNSPEAFKGGDQHRPARLAGLHLLIVEDNELNRQVASELLRDEGAEVDLADGGLAGVEKVLSNEGFFDLVIMDMQMPDIDGLEATRRIRAREDFKNLPILAMTANVTPEDRAVCLAAGMNDHVGKPIDMEELVPTILELVKRVPPRLRKKSRPGKIAKQKNLVENITAILKRFGGNSELYGHLFSNFRDDFSKLLEVSIAQIQQQKIETAIVGVHSAKSMAATLGASELAEKTGELESDLKSSLVTGEHPAIKDSVSELMELLDRSCLKLQQQFQRSQLAKTINKATKIPLTQEEWRNELVAILGLLSADNLSAIDRLETLFHKAQPELKVLLSEALTQANALQYSAAINAIDRLLGSSPNGNK